MTWSKVFAFIFCFSLLSAGTAQTIAVTSEQGLSFGDFTQTSDLGGTVSISNTGARSSTGSITLIGSSSASFYSIFSITTDSATPVTVTINEPTAILSGSNGGTMSLTLGVSDPEAPSVSSVSPAEVHIGGTLTLGSRAESPPGTYAGNVLITFTINNQ